MESERRSTYGWVQAVQRYVASRAALNCAITPEPTLPPIPPEMPPHPTPEDIPPVIDDPPGVAPPAPVRDPPAMPPRPHAAISATQRRGC